MNLEIYKDYMIIKAFSDFLKDKGVENIDYAVVLGSGLSSLAENEQFKLIATVDFSQLPFLPNLKAVRGHSAKLVFVEYKSKKILFMCGRLHIYQGYTPDQVVLPIRAFRLLGAKILILTNAAGSLNENIKPGNLVVIKDHINFMFTNPLLGPNIDQLGPRFPDMSCVYDLDLREKLFFVASKLNIDLKAGVYLSVLGPMYETPAEIKFFKLIGADLVGMSTVPEAIAARHAGFRVCAVSCATNWAAGISKQLLSHKEVIETSKLVETKFKTLLTEFLKLDLVN